MRIVGRTDRGRVRLANQDAVGCDGALGIAVLADGMGGLQQGDLASREAVRFLLARLTEAATAGAPIASDDLGGWVGEANRHVWRLAQAQRPPAFMGTTGVALRLERTGRALLAHVGDSRAYHLRDGELLQLTRDHSLVQERVESGLLTPQEARRSPQRNVITRALGLGPEVEVDHREFRIGPRDRVLLCSDGLWDMLSHEQIADRLREADLERAADELITAANAAGGQDNVSVVLAAL